MKQGKMWSMGVNGQEQFAPETMAAAVFMDESGQKTIVEALSEIELTPGPAGPTGPQGPAGSDATVTKQAVESVLTGSIVTHSHTPQHIGAAPASHTHTRANITDFAHTHTPAEAGAAPASHSHTKANITDFPASLPANGGNADTVGGINPTAFQANQSNWSSRSVINNVAGLLAWKNYGNSHTIFDASNGTTPSGSGCDRSNSVYAWSATYPTLMGWNGGSTYGVRVDSARVADQLASTAYIINLVYPVGSIYMSVNATNPGSLFGGTWVAWGAGRVPVCVNTGDGNFNTVEKTGGESAHTLSGNEMPYHNHAQDSHNHSQDGHSHSQDAHGHNVMVGIPHSDGETLTGEYLTSVSLSYGSHRKRYIAYQNSAQPYINWAAPYIYPNTPAIGYAGASWAHNNLQPYITCYMWKRTA